MTKQPKRYHFVVRGHGPFPLDMLRYDCCWPATSEDVFILTYDSMRKEGEISEVHLVGVREPTLQRWNSFNWTAVIEKVE